jgi:hypothetical protein
MEKLTSFLDGLSLEELQKMIDEHDNGVLKQRLHEKIAENAYTRKTCPVCHTPVEEGTLTLTFGSKDFRRKATFCAYDCLLYFANQINEKELNPQKT